MTLHVYKQLCHSGSTIYSLLTVLVEAINMVMRTPPIGCCSGRGVVPAQPAVHHSWAVQLTCNMRWLDVKYLLLSDLFRSLADRWGTTAGFTTSFLHSLRFSAFRSSIFHSRPVPSLMLSSHRFLCLPLRLPFCTVPCRYAPDLNKCFWDETSPLGCLGILVKETSVTAWRVNVVGNT